MSPCFVPNVSAATRGSFKRWQVGARGRDVAFLRQNKKYWLLPILLVLFVVGGLLVFAQSSALAPFIYSIF